MNVPQLLRECLACPNECAQDLAYDLLTRNGYSPQCGSLYTYGPGTVPVCLVAHTDTVHPQPPSKLFYCPATHTLTGDRGLGADDRAGVYAVARLLADGHRPHVLFTDQEETGGAGAQESAGALAVPLSRCRLLIQLDRRGESDAVYYSCASPSLEKWVARHGFTTATGTFTDISTLMPEVGTAGVNLSVGYVREHTVEESLRLDWLDRTVRRVSGMLTRPPKRRFRYKSRPVALSPWWERSRALSFDGPWCDWCGKPSEGGRLCRSCLDYEEEYLRMERDFADRDEPWLR